MAKKIFAPFYKKPSALATVAFALAALLPQSSFAGMKEDFSTYQNGRSIYVKDGDWRKFGTGKQVQPRGNTAIVKTEDGRNFLTMVARGDDDNNARAYRQVQLPVSASANNTVLADMRLVTPGTENEIPTTINVSFNGSKDGKYHAPSGLSMGIQPRKEGTVFFFHFAGSGGARIMSDPQQVEVNPQSWYRFGVQIDPQSGRFQYIVQDVSGAEPVTVWSGDNAGMADYKPVEFSQINIMVSRPGRSPEVSRSADFANLSVGP